MGDVTRRRDMPQIERYMDKCQHFNGLMNTVCRAGVVYDAVKVRHDPIHYDGPYSSGMSVPCIPTHNYSGTATCPKFAQVTREQAEAMERETKAVLAKFFGDLKADRCPHCGREKITKEQVGRCVYAVECGHRLYQGYLPGQRQPEHDL